MLPPTERRGVPISAPAAVFLELATLHQDLLALVVLGDSLVRRTRISPETLVAAAAGWSGRGSRLARRAAGLVRKGVDSAMETRLRLLIVLAGLPEPTVNFIVRDQNGDWTLRSDLSYPGLKLIIEYDGDQHRQDPQQWSRDLRRREWLERKRLANHRDQLRRLPSPSTRDPDANSPSPRRHGFPRPAHQHARLGPPFRPCSSLTELATGRLWALRSVIGGPELTHGGVSCRRGESNPYVLADRRV